MHHQPTVADVLFFWFGPPKERGGPHKRWFEKSEAFDREIRERFLPLHEDAAAGKLSHLKQNAADCLALIVLLDQFPRNMFRGTPRAFATDAKARLVADWAVDRGYDLQFKDEQERLFFYLPFEHSEDLDDQHRAVELVRQRCPTDPEILRYAILHRDVIEKFGRFPHRNPILGRRSTPDEEEYLKGPGAGF
jgi:uncharacterized protein (DUF924 family)